ncbi:peptidoglycan bridge formation glycyltransferase FemA/FemB family protein [Candidatus Uhrbacteria bacterium]|nr:peptidoglycan bridge formation glycyltransferase FemA/FemB family protein [Candidatus Uhrbacteria bacterium]
MHLIEMTDQKIWDGFVMSQPWAQFTQSWMWGEFQKSQGHKVKRFFLVGAGLSRPGQGDPAPTMAIQLIQYKKRFSGYWFAPRGPIFATHTHQDLRQSFRICLEEILKQKLAGQTLFYRFEPAIRLKQGHGMMPRRLRRNHMMSPSSTILIDLKKSEEELLVAMHPKTRYNIRVAEKHGVMVREGKTSQDFASFLTLLNETAERDQFDPHGARYLQALWDFLSPSGMAQVCFAERDGIPLAANLEIGYGDTLTYLHGASSSSARELMAPYALHWDTIKTAKSEDFHFYDLWGCNPESKAAFYYKPSWEGITRFKLGWGGERVDLIGTWDLPINRVLYRLAFPEGWYR